MLWVRACKGLSVSKRTLEDFNHLNPEMHPNLRYIVPSMLRPRMVSSYPPGLCQFQLPPTPVQIWAGVPQGLDAKTIFEACLMQSKGPGPTENSVEAST